jgi:hypothetical protein
MCNGPWDDFLRSGYYDVPGPLNYLQAMVVLLVRSEGFRSIVNQNFPTDANKKAKI